MKLIKKYLGIYDYIIWLGIAFAFTASPYYITDGACKIDLSFLFSAISVYLSFLFFVFFLRFLVAQKQSINLHDNIRNNTIRHPVITLAILMFIIWLPTLLSLFPGTLINDTWGQLSQYIKYFSKSGVLSDHHPVLDTLIIGTAIVPLSKITGEWQIVIFLYILIQSAITCIVFSYTIYYSHCKLNIGNVGCTILFLFYTLIPIFAVCTQTVSKDALFSWIFILFYILFLEIVRDGEVALQNSSFVLKLTIISIFCCLTKKVGIYVILFSFFCIFAFIPKIRKYITIPIIAIFLTFFLIKPLIFNITGITRGGKQEMFSIPFQQTARYVRDHASDISPEEYEIIDNLLDIHTLADRYDPINADPVKGYTERGTTEDYIKYVKVWILQGLRHPKTYLAAFNAMLSGWFSWTEYSPLMNMDWHNQMSTSLIPEWVSQRSGIVAFSSEIYQNYYHSLYNNSLIKVLFTYGFYASILPAFIVSTLIKYKAREKYHYWLAVLPMLFSLFLGCWLAPVSIHFEGRRYLYPVIYSLPLLLSWCSYSTNELQKNETNRNI